MEVGLRRPVAAVGLLVDDDRRKRKGERWGDSGRGRHRPRRGGGRRGGFGGSERIRWRWRRRGCGRGGGRRRFGPRGRGRGGCGSGHGRLLLCGGIAGGQQENTEQQVRHYF